MKKLTIYLFVFLLSVINLFPQNLDWKKISSLDSLKDLSGWADSVKFKQEKLKIDSSIVKLKLSTDMKRIYTYSTDKFIRIWDTENGILLNEFQLKYNNIEDIDIHQNERYVAISIGMYSVNEICTYIYDYIQDTNLVLVNNVGNSVSRASGNKFIVFQENTNHIVEAITSHVGGDLWWGITGYFITIKLDSNIVDGEYGIGNPLYMKLSPDKNLLYFHGYIYSYSMPHGGQSKTSYYGNLIDFNSKKNTEVFKCDNVDFTFDNKYIAHLVDKNTIKLYNIEGNYDERTILLNNINDSNVVQCLAFTHKKNLFISTNNQILYWHFARNQIIDSIPLYNPSAAWQLLVSPDDKYLIGASRQGELRIWEIDKVVGVKDENKQRDNCTIIPNPTNQSATINLEISTPGKITIEIYNSFGQLVNTLIKDEDITIGFNYFHINCQHLNSGMYYIILKENTGELFYKKLVVIH